MHHKSLRYLGFYWLSGFFRGGRLCLLDRHIPANHARLRGRDSIETVWEGFSGITISCLKVLGNSDRTYCKRKPFDFGYATPKKSPKSPVQMPNPYPPSITSNIMVDIEGRAVMTS